VDLQASAAVREGSTQVEPADTAKAAALGHMYGTEDPGLDYWKALAERRREALEESLVENEELHTSLNMVEEEKTAVEKERDNLKEMAEQAEALAEIVKSLVPDEDTEEDEVEESSDGESPEKDEATEEREVKKDGATEEREVKKKMA
jgi:geminin